MKTARMVKGRPSLSSGWGPACRTCSTSLKLYRELLPKVARIPSHISATHTSPTSLPAPDTSPLIVSTWQSIYRGLLHGIG